MNAWDIITMAAIFLLAGGLTWMGKAYADLRRRFDTHVRLGR